MWSLDRFSSLKSDSNRTLIQNPFIALWNLVENPGLKAFVIENFSNIFKINP
jgi:hypothetical protein